MVVEKDQRLAVHGGLKRWQGATALTVGLAFAGLPSPAVPLDADDARASLRVDDADGGAAEALAVDAVMRLKPRPDPLVKAIIAT